VIVAVGLIVLRWVFVGESEGQRGIFIAAGLD